MDTFRGARHCHALMESRNGLVVGGNTTQANAEAEREAASELTQNLKDGATLGADKSYNAASFVEGLNSRKIGPHIAIQGLVSKFGTVRSTVVPPPPEVAASEAYKNQHVQAQSRD